MCWFVLHLCLIFCFCAWLSLICCNERALHFFGISCFLSFSCFLACFCFVCFCIFLFSRISDSRCSNFIVTEFEFIADLEVLLGPFGNQPSGPHTVPPDYSTIQITTWTMTMRYRVTTWTMTMRYRACNMRLLYKYRQDVHDRHLRHSLSTGYNMRIHYVAM